MEVQRKSNISYKEFMEEHHNPGIPVIFTDATKVWKANGLLTPDWFRKNYPDKESDVMDKQTGKPYTMAQVMDLVENSTVEKPAPYPLTFNITHEIPEMMDLLAPLNLNYAKPNWLENKLFKRGNFDYFNEIYHTAILPRVLMLGLMPFMMVVAYLTPGIGPDWHLWLTATILCYIGILVAIPTAFYNDKFFGALIRIPLIFFTMLMLLFKLKGANKKFIHTPHIHSAE